MYKPMHRLQCARARPAPARTRPHPQVRKTFDDARAHCAAFGDGGDLAAVTSAAEAGAVYGLLAGWAASGQLGAEDLWSGRDVAMWLGGSDAGGQQGWPDLWAIGWGWLALESAADERTAVAVARLRHGPLLSPVRQHFVVLDVLKIFHTITQRLVSFCSRSRLLAAQEGRFVWLSRAGADLTYTAWAAGQPDGRWAPAGLGPPFPRESGVLQHDVPTGEQASRYDGAARF